MAYTYVIYSAILDRYYVGHTQDSIEERLRKHISNHDGYTSKAKDWELVFSKAFDSKKEAHAFERQIKRWKSRKAVEELVFGA